MGYLMTLLQCSFFYFFSDGCSAMLRFFDFDRLREVTHTVARNLNRIIDINYYPVATAERSNLNHRPIGIGVQVRLTCPSAAVLTRLITEDRKELHSICLTNLLCFTVMQRALNGRCKLSLA